MKRVQVFLTAVFAALLLAACGGEEKVDGKSAREWKAEAERLQGQERQPATRSASKVETSEDARKRQAEEESKKFVARMESEGTNLVLDKDAWLSLTTRIVRALQPVSRGFDDDGVYLGGVASLFSSDAMRELAPEIAKRKVSYETILRGKDIIRNAVVTWAVQEPKRLESVWAVARQPLRGQYGLLKTLRGYEKIFKTPYTRQGYAKLRECLAWQEEFQDAADVFKSEAKGCNAEYKKFGVAAQFVSEGNTDMAPRPVRNALWIVKFLERREGDGGEKFAQVFQRLALDYIK